MAPGPKGDRWGRVPEPDPAPRPLHGSMILSGPATGGRPRHPCTAAANGRGCCHRSCLRWPLAPALPRRPPPPRPAGATARTPHLVRFTSRLLPPDLVAAAPAAQCRDQIISHCREVS